MAPCPARRCCYCKSGNHYIQQCDSDPHLKYIFESKIMPDFRSMKAHVLKRLCSIIKKKTNEHKNELVNNLETYWNKKHGKVEENEQNDEKEPCAICLEKITENNSCITKCGHHFCLTCLLQHYSNNNSCPLCREKISENEVEQEQSVYDFGEFNQPILNRTVSYNSWADEEEEELHDYFETDDNITVIDMDDSIRDLDIVNTNELEYQPTVIQQGVFEQIRQPTISEPTVIQPTVIRATSINPTNYNETYSTLNNDLINRITLLEQFSNNENNEIANDMYRFIYNRINTQIRSEINNHINERVIELVNSRLNNLTYNNRN